MAHAPLLHEPFCLPLETVIRIPFSVAKTLYGWLGREFQEMQKPGYVSSIPAKHAMAPDTREEFAQWAMTRQGGTYEDWLAKWDAAESAEQAK